MRHRRDHGKTQGWTSERQVVGSAIKDCLVIRIYSGSALRRLISHTFSSTDLSLLTTNEPFPSSKRAVWHGPSRRAPTNIVTAYLRGPEHSASTKNVGAIVSIVLSSVALLLALLVPAITSRPGKPITRICPKLPSSLLLTHTCSVPNEMQNAKRKSTKTSLRNHKFELECR